MFDLTGKRALVTGASGKIGEAIARILHGQGASLVLVGRRVEPLENLAHQLAERCHILPADLQELSCLATLPEQAAQMAGGGMDILVNNAGLTRDGLAMRMKPEAWQTVLDVNLSAAFHLSRACLRDMMKARWGRIISIGSVVGATGNPGQTNYVASKAGLVGMSKALAAEVASRGITVNCVAPGFIASAMTDDLSEAQQQQILANIPVGRIGEARDVAAAVLYLSSSEASYVTGETLHVNGGLAMI